MWPPPPKKAEMPGDKFLAHIKLKVKGQDGDETSLMIRPNTQLRKLMTAYGNKRSLDVDSVRLFFDGLRLRPDQTPKELGLEDGDEIDAHPPQRYPHQKHPEEMSGVPPLKEKKSAHQPSGYINVKVLNQGQDGDVVSFLIKPNSRLRKLMNAYCEMQSLEVDTVRFLFEGHRLPADKTPKELGLEDGDEIDAMLDQDGGGGHVANAWVYTLVWFSY